MWTARRRRLLLPRRKFSKLKPKAARSSPAFCAAYNNLKLTIDHVTEGIAKLKASLATREKTIAQRALAEIELRRAKNLLQSNSGTQQVVDQREAAYQVATATEIEAHEQVHLAPALGLPAVPPLSRSQKVL